MKNEGASVKCPYYEAHQNKRIRCEDVTREFLTTEAVEDHMSRCCENENYMECYFAKELEDIYTANYATEDKEKIAILSHYVMSAKRELTKARKIKTAQQKRHTKEKDALKRILEIRNNTIIGQGELIRELDKQIRTLPRLRENQLLAIIAHLCREQGQNTIDISKVIRLQKEYNITHEYSETTLVMHLAERKKK